MKLGRIYRRASSRRSGARASVPFYKAGMNLVHEDVMTAPYRVLVRPDGCRWCARAAGAELRLCVFDAEGDRTLRRRKMGSSAETSAALEQLVAEQLADGSSMPVPATAFLELRTSTVDQPRTAHVDYVGYASGASSARSAPARPTVWPSRSWSSASSRPRSGPSASMSESSTGASSSAGRAALTEVAR